jgi:hypothetical protein
MKSEKASVFGCSFIKIDTLMKNHMQKSEEEFVLMTCDYYTIGTVTLKWVWTLKEESPVPGMTPGMTPGMNKRDAESSRGMRDP